MPEITLDQIRMYQPENVAGRAGKRSRNTLQTLLDKSPALNFPAPHSSSLSSRSQHCTHPLPPRPPLLAHDTPLSFHPPAQSACIAQMPNDFDRVLEEFESEHQLSSRAGPGDPAGNECPPSQPNPVYSREGSVVASIKVEPIDEPIISSRVEEDIEPRTGSRKDLPIVIDDVADAALPGSPPHLHSNTSAGRVDGKGGGDGERIQSGHLDPLSSFRPTKRLSRLRTREASPVAQRLLRSGSHLQPYRPSPLHHALWKKPRNPISGGWVVKKVLGSRYVSRGGKKVLEYRVRWADTWEPRENVLPGCDKLVKAYLDDREANSR
ncbi:hypothetical protein LOZ65_006894 [Ophidiomyces ophidiicola]|nr:hypothetical protein LOZ65_006894 [Ophidiomyces ophidiicola]